MIRGLDRYFIEHQDEPAFCSEGAVLINAGSASAVYTPGPVFLKLDYDVAVHRDDDADDQINKAKESAFLKDGGSLFMGRTSALWKSNCFPVCQMRRLSGSSDMLKPREARHWRETISKPLPKKSLDSVDDWLAEIDDAKRNYLAQAALKFSWFKSISLMEAAAYEIIEPDLENAGESLNDVINDIFMWANPA